MYVDGSNKLTISIITVLKEQLIPVNILAPHLYRPGLFCSMCGWTSCSNKLYTRMGREVKQMLYSVR